MTHILDNLVGVAVDTDHQLGWPGNLPKLRTVRADDAAISVALFDPHLTVKKDDPHGRKEGEGVVTKDTLDNWRKLGGIPGLRLDPSWIDWPEPGLAAQWASDQIARFDDYGIRRVDVVEYDVETHTRDWQVRFLLGYTTATARVKGIRGQGGDYPDPSKPWTLGWRWGRPGVYTFEGRQTMGTSAGDVAARAGLKVAPQLYNGAMDQVWDGQREFRYWCVDADFPVSPSAFTVYSDAARDNRPHGLRNQLLFAATRLTELYE